MIPGRLATRLYAPFALALTLTLFQGACAYVVDSEAYRNGSMGAYPAQTYETIPGEYPIFNFDRVPENHTEEYIFLSMRGPNMTNPGALILDWSGGLVWDGTGYGESMSFSVQTYLGNPVLAFWAGEIFEGGWGRGHLLLLDQTYTLIANISTTLADQGQGVDFHDAQITSNDTALIVVYNEHKDENLLSGVVQEINITTGQAVFTWDSRDHIDPADCYANRTEGLWDYIHINSVEKDVHGNYLFSSRHCCALYYVAPNGTILWTMGGKQSNFTGTTFSWQHDARWHGDQISLFDNGASTWTQTAPLARGVIIDIDYDSMSIRETHFNAPTGQVSPSQGNFQKLPNGNWLAGWGSQSFVTEFSADGQELWTAQIGLKQQSYRTLKANWTGYPRSNPSIKVNNSPPSGQAGNQTDVQVLVSWSGATEVQYYLLSADGSEVGRTDHQAFEDAFSVRQTALDGKKWIQVTACSQNASILGVSDRYSLVNGTTEPVEQTRTVGTASFTPQSTTPTTNQQSPSNAAGKLGLSGRFAYSLALAGLLLVT